MQRGFIAGLLAARYSSETAIRLATEVESLDPMSIMQYLARYTNMTGLELVALGRTYAALCDAAMNDVTPYLGEVA